MIGGMFKFVVAISPIGVAFILSYVAFDDGNHFLGWLFLVVGIALALVGLFFGLRR